MRTPWSAYDEQAAALARLYESLTFEQVHGVLLDLLPPPPARVLDVGAGTGRDAAWFEARGYRVVACEPSAGMRREARARRPGAEARWVDDALPELASLAGEAFDFILLGGVWMHVAPEDRPRALDALAALLAPGGRLALSLRHGPDPGGRGFHPVSGDEVAALAEARGLRVLRRVEEEDGLGREGVRWTNLVVGRDPSAMA